VLATAQGECIGYGLGGPGNPTSAGPERAAEGVLTAVARALALADAGLSDVTVIIAAMAGQRAGSDAGDWLLRRLEAEGFAGELAFESDLLAIYFSGSAEDRGYAVVAGTGACAVRVRGGRVEATGDGLGWLLGDRGGGFWIGHRVARAALRDLDGAGPSTTLTAAVLDHVGIATDAARGSGRRRDVERLIEALYAVRPVELSRLAPLAFAADDPVAAGILRRAGEHLARTLAGVLDGPGPLVVGGSVLFRAGPVREAFVDHLGGAADGLELRPVVDGAIGAGQLALRAAGVSVTAPVLERLHDSLSRFR